MQVSILGTPIQKYKGCTYTEDTTHSIYASQLMFKQICRLLVPRGVLGTENGDPHFDLLILESPCSYQVNSYGGFCLFYCSLHCSFFIKLSQTNKSHEHWWVKKKRKESCTTMFTAALFTIARIWKRPKCPLTDEWIKKMWHIYTMEYYSAIKRNKIEIFVVRGMDLESFIQSEVSQKEKTKYHILTHICGI